VEGEAGAEASLGIVDRDRDEAVDEFLVIPALAKGLNRPLDKVGGQNSIEIRNVS